MKTLRAYLAVVCVLAIALCAILIVQKAAKGARLDLTQNKLYTLSQGTRNIIGKLNQPITLKLFYSRTAMLKGPEQIRFYNNYYLYVRDLLEEYVRLSNGKLKLQVIDPRKYSEEEDEAIALGLLKLQGTGDETVFFGLAAQTEYGKTKAVPFFEPARMEFAEYDISKLISGVSQRDKKKIGVLSSIKGIASSELSPYMIQMLQMQGKDYPKPWIIITQLRNNYDVRALEVGQTSIPDDIDMLLVIQPKKFPKETLFAIDQFVMKGKPLAVFLDAFAFSDTGKFDTEEEYLPPTEANTSDLNALLDKWGVKMEKGAIAVDTALGQKAPVGSSERMVQFLPYMILPSRDFNKSNVVTSKLGNVRILFAGALEQTKASGSTVTPLMTTDASTGGTWTPKNAYELQQPDPDVIRKDMVSNEKPVMLGCEITGKLQSNFPDGIEVTDTPPPAAPTASEAEKKAAEPRKKTLEAIKEAQGECVVFVYSDVDMISDKMAYRETIFGPGQLGDNASVLFNTLDYMGGSTDLISIRSRTGFNHPFTVVDNIEQQAEKATADEIKAVSDKIQNYQAELNKIGSQSGENEKIVAGKAVAERAKLEEEMRQAKKELRRLNAQKRAKIEALGAQLQFNNMVWAPAIILAIAVVLAVVRYVRAKRYLARRAQS